MPKSPRKRKSPKKRALKPCQPTQERNPNTNRCIKKCPVNTERNPDNFKKCRKSCIPPQERNIVTGRCRKPSVIRQRKRKVGSPKRRNPVRLSRKKKSPIQERECSVCLNPTTTRTFCTSGVRHPLCQDCYYLLLQTGIHYCPICREFMTRPPNI